MGYQSHKSATSAEPLSQTSCKVTKKQGGNNGNLKEKFRQTQYRRDFYGFVDLNYFIDYAAVLRQNVIHAFISSLNEAFLN